MCVKFHERNMRVIKAHYYSVLVKRQLTNTCGALTARRACRADKHMANRHRGDGEAEKTLTSLLFMRSVSDDASQGRSAFRPARRPWSRNIFGNLRGVPRKYRVVL